MLAWLRNGVWPVLKTTWARWNQHDGWLLSAAMSYYAAFSLFPICLCLIAILGLASRFSAPIQDQQQQLLAVVQQNAGPWLAEQLRVVLAGVQERVGVGGPLGLATLLFAVIGLFMQLQSAFDRIWDRGPPPPRSWLATIGWAIRERLSAFLLLWLIGLLLLALFIANVALSGFKAYVVELPAGHTAWQIAQVTFTVLANTLLVAVIYKRFSGAAVRWRTAGQGGFLVALVWQLGQQLLIAYVIGSKYSAYGVVGSFIAVMLWLYYASAVVFGGAEFVWVIAGRSRPAPEA